MHVQQPQQGDFARLAGYVEKDYGARDDRARTGWDRAYFQWLSKASLGSSGLGDVLIFGDSFTRAGQRLNWANQFARLTGLDVRATAVANWRQVLDSSEFRNNPPKLVILQSVERDVIDYLVDADRRLGPGENSDHGLPAIPLKLSTEEGSKMTMAPKTFSGFDERISTTLDYIWKRLQRQFGRVPLGLVLFSPRGDAPTMFSARKNQDFLALPEDLRTPQKHLFTRAVSGYQKLRSALSANGQTRVSLLVVPNRLSVYRPYLSGVDSGGQLILDKLANELDSFNPVGYLRAKVEQGTKDIYWPMDTHLSAVGSRLLAEEYIRFLLDKGVLANADI